MSISQSKHNNYTKGLSSTEAQILSIVKRYFEVNPGEIEGSIEHITLEVLRRVKEEILNAEFNFTVSSINGQMGEVTLTATDVGAEPSFEKASAFNKEFGSEEGTVCEGNDPRLSDARPPTEHGHEGYILEANLELAMKMYLEKKGITFTEDDIIIKKDMILQNAKISEVTSLG
jgi:hypothetical protein